jgi:hypothetical protein
MLVKPTVKSRTQPAINERADVLHLSNGMIVQRFREEGERTIGAALLNLRILKRSLRLWSIYSRGLPVSTVDTSVPSNNRYWLRPADFASQQGESQEGEMAV